MLNTDTDRAADSGYCADIMSIVILDDNDFDLRRLKKMVQDLDRNATIIPCKTLDEFQAALDTGQVDLCLVDHTLGDGNTSEDALKVIYGHEHNALTPAIMVSGTDDDLVLSSAIQNGFSSFLNKERLSVERLRAAIGHIVNQAAEQEISNNQRRTLVRQAMDNVAMSFSENTRPHLSKIYEHGNFVRQCVAARQLPSIEVIDRIEDHCFRIWRFLDEIEHHDVAGPGRKH